MGSGFKYVRRKENEILYFFLVHDKMKISKLGAWWNG